MKIYTKTGDKGETSLIGGTRVLKSHLRIETYGTVDELNSYIGVVSSQTSTAAVQTVLKEIQDRLFTVGSLLAADPEKSRMKLPDLHEADVTLLEDEIDRMNATLPDLKHFILPGGGGAASFCHVARSVCRRAERLAISLSTESAVDQIVIMYLNRLSDYLFVLARKLCMDAGNEENKWIPRI
ncbi:cob(I)yrinic acid a,c-diamide adenosyltransferase [Pedobacter sp. SYP-B3415]|uniref:cob(I)yrinic acid a,c-diamide adenosyltransferase n=1 Tax=Pedobacter sp. SYP-B3415 TaxID=2496641 RepID=UPI00101B9545|nr:cob(I)yrinic acid a,c-diamide adenosyltransferase [Pedobacter sp. SYP-B3415]